MATQVVTYQLDDSTKVRFEVEPVEGFRPAGAGQIAGRVRDAVGPAVDAAKAVLDKVKEVGPDEVEVRFGIKVSGGADWLVAKAAGEASFEIKLTWGRRGKPDAAATEAMSTTVEAAEAKPTRPGALELDVPDDAVDGDGGSGEVSSSGAGPL